MGLGKTLTMLALIVNTLEASSRILEQAPERDKVLPTLIVTPLSREYVQRLKSRKILKRNHSTFIMGRADREVFLKMHAPE